MRVEVLAGECDLTVFIPEAADSDTSAMVLAGPHRQRLAVGCAGLRRLDDTDARQSLSTATRRWAGANLSEAASFGPFFSWLSGNS